MASKFEKLQVLLSELFQLGQADLDFGIYRIMNQKRDEINRFLEKDLLPQVKTAFAQYQPVDKKALEEKLLQASQAAIAAGFEPEQSPKVKQIREELATFSVDTGALENEVYSHLYSFFRRYYDNGDFISLRRYKEGVYAIPYEGEEVKLHWANADQYYIKTSEYFRDYSFKLPSGRTAHFKIVEADIEKDNVKAAAGVERRFILATNDALQVENDEMVMRFEYRADGQKREQKALNEACLAAILAQIPAEWAKDASALAPTESNTNRTVLEKHLNDYTTRNTFDYFIHKDLGSFLRRELDFYIKNEVMRLDDIENEAAPRVEQYLSKIKVLRQIAHKIIVFLAQIEDFQKKLWLKKKFVVETNYCVTLDRVPEELYPEICANEAQREEWVRLFAIDEIKGDLVTPGYSNPLTINFLKTNPFLVLDTRFFSPQFTNTLLAGIEDIDAQIDGLLIHSENFQALNFLTPKYKKSFDFVYIDPPYNTNATEIIYKNGFKDSSWLSLLDNRLSIAQYLIEESGMICVTIDDNEVHNLTTLMKTIFLAYEIFPVVIEYNHRGRVKNNFAVTHEYGLWGVKKDRDLITKLDEISDDIKRNLRRTGVGSLRVESPSLFYGIKVRKSDLKIMGVTNIVALGEEIPNNPDPEIEVIYPIDSDGIERRWYYGRDRIIPEVEAGTIWAKIINSSIQIHYWQAGKEKRRKSVWTGSELDGSTFGTELLNSMFVKSEFSFPKSIHAVMTSIEAATNSKDALILDFFSGSGTTGHAVLNLNRKDNGERKYVLVEMGNHFKTVLKPRILKAIYSNDWDRGKPVSHQGSSHCFKYLRLESYEDTLNNLALQRSPAQQLALEQAPADFRESYLLAYMLDTESQSALLNTRDFVHPFDYQLRIATGTVGESKPTKVDLVETFNYLIGLRVQTMQHLRGFRVITGLTPEGEKTLIIWRDLAEKSNADLEAFFRKQDYNPRDMEFDLIYVNGDNNLENLRRPDETWKVRLIEEEFLRCMFNTQGM